MATRYIFRGNLCGIMCGDCQEFLSGVKVRLYRLRPDQDTTRLAVADPKTTFDVLDADQISAKQTSLLGEFETDAAGTGLTISAQPFGFPGAHGGPGFGFWSSMKLIGDCPTTHPSGGQPMRYRFTTRPTGSGGTPTPITGPGMVDAVKVGTRPVPWNFGAGISIYPQDIYVAGSGGYVGPMPAPPPTPPPGSPPGSWGPMPPLILQPNPLGWVTMPPDATNQGFSGPLMRFNSDSIAPGGTPPGPVAGNPVPLSDQKNGVDYQMIFEAEPVSGPSPSGPTLRPCGLIRLRSRYRIHK